MEPTPARFKDRQRAFRRERAAYSRKVSKRLHQLKGYAKAMKRRMTKPEYLLWQVIRGWQKPFRPKPQWIIATYIADFAFTKQKVVVEIDGKDHHTPLGRWKDQKRTTVLEVLGWKVIRFTNEEVLANELAVAEKIRIFLSAPVLLCPPAHYKPEVKEDFYS